MTQAIIEGAVPSTRGSANGNHHLWNNNGTWWCHYTIHLPDFTKRRVRVSLHTGNVRVARLLRDSLLFELANRV